MWFLIPILFAGYALKKSIAPKGVVVGNYVGAPQSKDAIDAIALAKFRAVVRQSEGYRLDAYYDSLGILTVGIGHKVLSSDKLKFGDVITAARAEALFAADTKTAFAAAQKQALELNKYTADFLVALSEVNYQLGTGWKNKFSNTWKYLKAGQYKNAISNLLNSAWHSQTPVRVKTFVAAIQSAYGSNIA